MAVFLVYFNVLMEPVSYKKLLVTSWNVRGLGEPDKCRDVRATLAPHHLHILCLQETKLSDITTTKATSFLPPGLTNFTSKNSVGASGGLLNAWARHTVRDKHHIELDFSLTSFFESTVDSLTFAVTNIYGPCTDDRKEDFLNELRHLSNALTLG